MKHKIYITITLATLTSCQLLKKEKLTVKAQRQKEELKITEQRNTLRQQSKLVLIDSSQNDFTTTLWPKGKFTFSVTKGFEGEAEKILIKGKQVQQKTLTLKQETEQDSSLLKATYTNDKENSTVVKKNKLSVGYNWAWLLLIPVLYGCYRLKRFVIR